MASPTVGEVLEVLRPSFQGIDLRAIIVSLGDRGGWLNVFTVIRLSAKTPEEISVKHDKLKKLFDLPDQFLNKRLGEQYNIQPYKGMSIKMSAHSIGQFEQLMGRIHEGIIRADDMAFRVADADLSIKLTQEDMSFSWPDYQENGHCWATYCWGKGDQRVNFQRVCEPEHNAPARLFQLNSSDLDTQARSIGFGDFRDLVEGITEHPFRRGSGQALEIFAPVYASIESITTSSDVVKVTGYFHPALGELTLECYLYDNVQQPHRAGRLLKRVRISPQTVGQELTRFVIDFSLVEPPETGHIQACLFKKAATRVDLHEERSPLRSGVLAFRAFTSFVPEKDITEYLGCLTSGTNIETCHIYRVFKPKDNSKKKDELIEYVVTYLLGLCQLNPILLSNPQYDVIDGGLQAGSADILASAQGGSPVLVSCTMAMPDDRKRGMLTAAQTAIAKRTKASPQAIKLLLITGKPSVSASSLELVELAAADLEKLWAMIRDGNLPEARRLLGLD